MHVKEKEKFSTENYHHLHMTIIEHKIIYTNNYIQYLYISIYIPNISKENYSDWNIPFFFFLKKKRKEKRMNE